MKIKKLFNNNYTDKYNERNKIFRRVEGDDELERLKQAINNPVPGNTSLYEGISNNYHYMKDNLILVRKATIERQENNRNNDLNTWKRNIKGRFPGGNDREIIERDFSTENELLLEPYNTQLNIDLSDAVPVHKEDLKKEFKRHGRVFWAFMILFFLDIFVVLQQFIPVFNDYFLPFFVAILYCGGVAVLSALSGKYWYEKGVNRNNHQYSKRKLSYIFTSICAILTVVVLVFRFSAEVPGKQDGGILPEGCMEGVPCYKLFGFMGNGTTVAWTVFATILTIIGFFVTFHGAKKYWNKHYRDYVKHYCELDQYLNELSNFKDSYIDNNPQTKPDNLIETSN